MLISDFPLKVKTFTEIVCGLAALLRLVKLNFTLMTQAIVIFTGLTNVSAFRRSNLNFGLLFADRAIFAAAWSQRLFIVV